MSITSKMHVPSRQSRRRKLVLTYLIAQDTGSNFLLSLDLSGLVSCNTIQQSHRVESHHELAVLHATGR